MNKKIFQFARNFYYFLVFAISLFYLFADFSKAITKQYGIALFGLLICLLLLHNKPRGQKALVATISLVQLPPLYCWVYFMGGRVNLGGIDCSVTWYGIVMHVSVVVIGGTFLHYSLKNIDCFGRGGSRNQI